MNMQLTADGIFVGVIGTLLALVAGLIIASAVAATNESNIKSGNVIAINGHAYVCKELKP